MPAVRTVLLLLASSYPVQCALTQADRNLIVTVTEQAAFMQAYADFCADRSPAIAALSRQALMDWQNRNHWHALRRALDMDERFRAEFEEMRDRSFNQISKDGERSAAICPHLPDLMSQPQFDSSVKRGTDLNRIAVELGRVSSGVSSNSPGPPVAVVPSTRIGGWRRVGEAKKASTPSDSAPGRRLTEQPALADAVSITVGEIAFSVPTGWSLRSSQQNAVILAHNGALGQTSQIHIAAAPMQGSISDSLRQTVRSWFPSIALTLNRIKEGKTVHGYPAAYFDENAREARLGKEHRVTGVAYGVNGRLHAAILISEVGAESYDRKRELEAMVHSFRFLKAPPLTWDLLHPPKGSGGLEGLYMGTQLTNRPNPLGGMQLIAKRDYVVFFPGGQVYNGLPDKGNVTVDFATALREHPRSCGIYSIHGDKIVVDMLADFDIVEQRSALIKRRDSGGITFFWPPVMGRMQPVHDLRLTGTYTFTYAMTGNTGLSSTSVVTQTFIEFNAEGRYRKAGFSAASFSNEAGGTTTSGTVRNRGGVEEGSYAINGFRLTLTPDRGSPESFTIVLEDPHPSAKALFINDKAFLKR